jgi:DnaJ-class molecular chaperone
MVGMGWAFHPVAICNVCGWPLSRAHLNLVNHRCEKPSAAGRCEGAYELAIDPKYWTRCVLCGGSGRISERVCELCHGTGWRYSRAGG